MKPATMLYALLILFSTSQCRKEQGVMDTIVNNPPPSSVRTFLALGDSYTIGQSVSVSERFPHQTAAFLRINGININEPRYIAATGWTTDNLREAIDAQQLSPPFSVVSLLIGVNDQYQRRDTTGYRQRFRILLLKSISLAGNEPRRVFVLSIPDYSVTPFAANTDTAFTRQQIDWFNNINRQETLLYACNYLDITPSTRAAATDPSLLAPDGLHPSGKEYEKWAGWLAPLMKVVL